MPPIWICYLINIDSNDRLTTTLYDKHDGFNFVIVNFPFISSNIPLSSAYESPAWRSGYSVRRKDLMILASGFESHCGTWVPAFRMRPCKPMSRVTIGVAR
jgi:hypothetical protein